MFRPLLFLAAVVGFAIAYGARHPRSKTSETSPTPAGIAENIPADSIVKSPDKTRAKKILFIGDSMTGWMAERLNAYGDANGFEVAAVVWDGSTIPKWAASGNLRKILEREDPDAVLVSLGMNGMFARNPEAQFGESLKKITDSFGDTPFLWIGPPSWPGHSEGGVFCDWLAAKLGEGHYFDSLGLTLPRQSKSNPHPSRSGIEKWMDEVVEWIPDNASFSLPGTDNPGSGKYSRGKSFTYKRMKEKL